MRFLRSTGYANVTATLALLVAMGGTSYAAIQITSSAQIANGVITGKDIKPGSIGTKQVAGLTGKDIKPGSIGTQQVKDLTTEDIKSPTVRGWARLYNDYTIDTANSRNITLVTPTGGGYYCLKFTGGKPISAMATIDVSGADTRYSQVGVIVDATAIAGTGCPAGTNLIATTGDTQNPAAVPKSFYIWVLA